MTLPTIVSRLRGSMGVVARQVLAGLLVAVLSAGVAFGQGTPITPPTAPLPQALSDVGATTSPSLPFVMACMGQSNAVGQDHSGSKTVGANIFVTNTALNTSTAPTALVPAVFGTAPLNLAVGGTTTDPALAYNNICVQAATALRASNTIPASRPIVILLNAFGAQSITDWVDASPPINMWTLFTQGLAVITAAYPGATINHVIWVQAENDNTGTYGTQATYAAAFARLIAELTALPQWTPDTRMTVQELGTWNDNTQEARNDFLRTLSNGAAYPFATLVSSSGMAESTDNPVPHFDGVSLVRLGQAHFQAWAAGAARTKYAGQTTYYGSALGFPNAITLAGTATLGADDIRTGASILAAGGTLTLPVPSFVQAPFVVFPTTNTTIATTGAVMKLENTGTSVASFTAKASTELLFVPMNGSYYVTSIFPKVGNATDCAQNSSFTANAAQSLAVGQWQSCIFTGSGNAIALSTGFGLHSVFINQATASQAMVITPSTGSVILPDGSTAATYSIPPGGVAMIEDGITATNTLATYVMWDSFYNAFRGYATGSRPTCTTLGHHIMDVTLHIPEWCDGTSWRDATGTVR